jgi:acetyl-CoA carboxylase biotin carboxyl carrier protein
MTERQEPRAGDAASLPGADASLLAVVDRLAALLERSDLLELEVEAGGTGITLRKSAALATPAAGPTDAPSTRAGDPPGGTLSPAPAGSAVDDPGGATTRKAVLAPLTGIWYASPTPGSPPFVEVGREVVSGQVIGLIEAMKLFNEIKSDVSGRVVRVVHESGTLVKAKHALIEVERL